jgi:hypothetical protein
VFGSTNPNQLIVEGWNDLFSVVGLMSAHVDWPDGKDKAPVYIEMGNGAQEILKDGFLSAYLKSPVIRTLGVMLDADLGAQGRYDRVLAFCSPFFSLLPSRLPRDGLITENAGGSKRFGLWVMPDNSSDGTLETFLKYLVPAGHDSTWKHAVDSVRAARQLGCPYKDNHAEKANLYTWLAWQDPPGQKPGECLTQKILDPHSPSAKPFVTWFRSLYKI